jgi:cysteine desulfuration protein SufE
MSKATIKEIQDDIIDEFALFDDWADKYEYIIDIGKKLPSLPDPYKTEANLIKGCQSQVWLHPHLEGDKIVFEGDSDAIIVRGLVGLMIRVLSGHRPEEIANADLYFIDKIGMSQHLAQTRSNGLASMVKQMKLYAIAYQAKLETK